ncbi:MAG: hypothetical protein ACKN9N_04890, partial [Actinomycetota bacterium]
VENRDTCEAGQDQSQHSSPVESNQSNKLTTSHHSPCLSSLEFQSFERIESDLSGKSHKHGLESRFFGGRQEKSSEKMLMSLSCGK